jgi:TonB family protein
MSVLVNGGILALLLVFGLKAKLAPVTNPSPAGNFKLSDLTLFAPSSAETAHGGGGGGSHDLIDPITGRLPKFSPTPIVPPMVPQVDHPRLVIDSAIAVPPEINLPDNPNLPNLGVYHSANVTLTSGGPGSAGIGTGFNGGVGPDSGNGAGPGYDHGAGGSIYTPDVGGVTAPIPTFTPEADFSEEARRAKYQGVCMISVIVDTHGNPVNPLVVRPLGMGLDEKALDAVRKYRFKPARKDGRPVPVMILVAVNFRLY